MFDEWVMSNKLVPLLKPRYHRVCREVMGLAMVDRYRLQNLWKLLSNVNRRGVPGDFVEMGVARGGTAGLIARAAEASRLPREVWLYDAFEDWDPPFARYAEVHDTLFRRLGLDERRVHLVKAMFDQAVAEYPGRPISLIHIDAGDYGAVADCIRGMYPHLAAAGWMVFDNYGADEGCRRAVDAFLDAAALRPALRRFGRTQAYLRKPASGGI